MATFKEVVPVVTAVRDKQIWSDSFSHKDLKALVQTFGSSFQAEY